MSEFVDNDDVEFAVKNNKDPAAKQSAADNISLQKGSYGNSPKCNYPIHQTREKQFLGGLANSSKIPSGGSEKEETAPQYGERKKAVEPKKGKIK